MASITRISPTARWLVPSDSFSPQFPPRPCPIMAPAPFGLKCIIESAETAAASTIHLLPGLADQLPPLPRQPPNSCTLLPRVSLFSPFSFTLLEGGAGGGGGGGGLGGACHHQSIHATCVRRFGGGYDTVGTPRFLFYIASAKFEFIESCCCL